MSIKIEIKGNYLFLTDTVGGKIDKASKGSSFYKVDSNGNYSFINKTGSDQLAIFSETSIAFADIVDSTGSAFASVSAFETFLNNNTGFSSSDSSSSSMLPSDSLKSDFHLSLGLQSVGIDIDTVDYSLITTGSIIARNDSIPTGADSTLWEMGGIRKRLHLEGSETMYASSDSASDTTQTILANVVDSSYNRRLIYANINGQNQVEMLEFGTDNAVSVMCILSALKQSESTADLVGNVWIAETDTLTGGVPNDSTKVQSKIEIGRNITNNGFAIIPSGETWVAPRSAYFVGKNKDVVITVNVQPFAFGSYGANYKFISSEVFETSVNIPFGVYLGLTEKTYVEYSVSTSTNDSNASVVADFIVVTNP